MVNATSTFTQRVTPYNLPVYFFCELGEKSPIPAYPVSSAFSAVQMRFNRYAIVTSFARYTS